MGKSLQAKDAVQGAATILDEIKQEIRSAFRTGNLNLLAGEKTIQGIYILPDSMQVIYSYDRSIDRIPATPTVFEHTLSQMVGKSHREARNIWKQNKRKNVFSGGKPAEEHCYERFSIIPEYKAMYERFLQALTANAKQEKISTEICIYDCQNKITFDFPATLKDKFGYGFYYKLVIWYFYTVSESSDLLNPSINHSVKEKSPSTAISPENRSEISKEHETLTITLTTDSSGTVKVHWNSIGSVKRYEILRCKRKPPFEKVGSADSFSVLYSDRQVERNKQYLYQVVAIVDDKINGTYRISSNIAVIQAGVISKSKEEVAPSEPEAIQNNNISIDDIEGHEFERFCAHLLRENGYERVTVTKESGDQGIDIIAYKDGVKFGIQCKCYATDIGNKAVQEAYSGKAYYNCHVGVVLTNRFFTHSAIELAQKNGILLWDRTRLLVLIQTSKEPNMSIRGGECDA